MLIEKTRRASSSFASAPHIVFTCTSQHAYCCRAQLTVLLKSKGVIELSSMNRLFIGLAAVALIAVGSMFVGSDRVESIQTVGGTSSSAFGASLFGTSVQAEDCAADCDEAASCSEADSAACREGAGDCTEGAGECNKQAGNITCNGAGAKDGSCHGQK
jgi:hypothetical protein